VLGQSANANTPTATGPKVRPNLGPSAQPKLLPAGKPSGGANLGEVAKPNELSTTSKQSERININSVGDVINNLNQIPQVGTADILALRQKWNIPDVETLAVAKTNVNGLEGYTFEGASPTVRDLAGLPRIEISAPNRPIKSSGKIPSATRHAEEDIANQFVYAVENAGIKPEDVNGTLVIHQSNPKGVCTTCLSGLGNPNVEAGIIKQLSVRYPNLIIKVTSNYVEGVRIQGKATFIVQNGSYIE
jgi:hypothetical protein